jgi:hypothetical protein
MCADGLHVEVQGGDIVVTLPGTSYRVVYCKPAGSPLPTKEFPVKNDRRASMKVATFLALARKLANAKGRGLGWIVQAGPRALALFVCRPARLS